MLFNFGIKDIIDIVLVALMLYYLYRLMKESRSLNVFIGIMFFILVWLLVSQVFEMRLLGGILDKLICGDDSTDYPFSRRNTQVSLYTWRPPEGKKLYAPFQFERQQGKRR